MVEEIQEIQEKLQDLYSTIQIEVEYLEIRKYKIILIKHNTIKDYGTTILKSNKNNDIIKKSVTFEYKWENNWTFSANIEQIKFTIDKYFKLYLER